MQDLLLYADKYTYVYDYLNKLESIDYDYNNDLTESNTADPLGVDDYDNDLAGSTNTTDPLGVDDYDNDLMGIDDINDPGLDNIDGLKNVTNTDINEFDDPSNITDYTNLGDIPPSDPYEEFNKIGNYFVGPKVDSFQSVIESFIINPFFMWVVIILILNGKNWKRPVVLILIVHWILRSIGDVFNNMIKINPASYEDDDYDFWPYNVKHWILGNISNIFSLLGEIVGDWYPLVRTKAVTKDNKKIKYVFLTCIIYNLIKLSNIGYIFFTYNKAKDYYIENLSSYDPDDPIFNKFDDFDLEVYMSKFQIYLYFILLAMQITSIFYDVSVICCLRKYLFNRINSYKTNNRKTFMEKFKQISEYRIIFSMIASIVFIPFVVTGAFPFLLDCYPKVIKGNEICLVRNSSNEDELGDLRRKFININFTLMYIDQILIRHYAAKNNTIHINSSNAVSLHNSNNKGLYSNSQALSCPDVDIKGQSGGDNYMSNWMSSSNYTLNKSFQNSSYLNSSTLSYNNDTSQNTLSYKKKLYNNNTLTSNDYYNNLRQYSNDGESPGDGSYTFSSSTLPLVSKSQIDNI
ncbi:hypothetical protein PIROE2DRAFT_9399 [Piromyces sp. E2]|nr:hypothetical protein PIROE2DRAFT_9399 [Piromyces sp. E2]|eukprot:OUM63944.1 hypothetical protein PIROE2DRAFT_9399 [Piromyces sp. E2]